MMKTKERFICCAVAAIMFFIGMCLDTTKIDSSFSYMMLDASAETINSVDYLTDDVDACTLDMLAKGTMSIRGNVFGSMNKWQNRAVLLLLVVGSALQYLFYYQSEECKEDGQLLLCRSVAVNYIHQKDGEK